MYKKLWPLMLEIKLSNYCLKLYFSISKLFGIYSFNPWGQVGYFGCSLNQKKAKQRKALRLVKVLSRFVVGIGGTDCKKDHDWTDTEWREGSKAKCFPKDTEPSYHYYFPTHRVKFIFCLSISYPLIISLVELIVYAYTLWVNHLLF